MTSLIARLDHWLTLHRPDYRARLLPGNSDCELDEIERRLIVRMPEALRAFYRWSDGQSVDDLDNFIFNYMLVGLARFRNPQHLATWRDYCQEFADPPAERGRFWPPFLHDGARWNFCVELSADESSADRVIVLNGDDGTWSVNAPNFEEWLRRLVESMQRFEVVIDDEDGEPLTFQQR